MPRVILRPPDPAVKLWKGEWGLYAYRQEAWQASAREHGTMFTHVTFAVPRYQFIWEPYRFILDFHPRHDKGWI